MGPIHVLSAFVPPMIAAGRGGHVVNVASAAALFGLPWHAAYSASKFGLRGVSEVLRFERHAKAPEHVAACIVKAVERDEYLVYTSPDVAVGAFFQRVFPWPYERAMRKLNDYLVSVAASE